jgi:hypothetical protein
MGDLREKGRSSMASHPITRDHMKSPVLLQQTVNAAAGKIVVDKWGLLDPTLAEKQLNGFSGFKGFRASGPLDRGITDPGWTPDQFAHACGLSTS